MGQLGGCGMAQLGCGIAQLGCGIAQLGCGMAQLVACRAAVRRPREFESRLGTPVEALYLSLQR
jgi:hypothetical protein